jgi:hypothetical protein
MAEFHLIPVEGVMYSTAAPMLLLGFSAFFDDFSSMLRIDPKASHRLGKCATTDLHL